MYARSTTIQAQPAAIDAGIAYLRDDALPALQEIDGCIGLSLLVDRESGRCIATSAWETQWAMYASADWVRPIREQAASAFCGSPDTARVEEWQIAMVHRDHHAHTGAAVRASWFKIRSAYFAAAIDVYKASVLPALEELDGFCSASLMTNSSAGRAVSSVTFDSLAAMHRNADQTRSLRTALLRDLGADQLDVAEFELAMAHLRVPELV
ncbi:MAG: hypothetical protein K2Q25_03190 [Mycobacteriaceae bacterium]|nr:hypothetical protein [Mycobacteriaceae bacterium]